MYKQIMEQIFIWKKNNRGLRPNMIVMHPDTYLDFEQESGRYMPFEPTTGKPYPFQGIEILRSYDVELGTFKIG